MKNRAFTLIELLVVIAVIAILSSFALVMLSDSKARGRDSRREGDMKQIQDGLQIYATNRQKYPDCPSGTVSVDTVNIDNNTFVKINGKDDCMSVALIGESFMVGVPVDPLLGSSNDCSDLDAQIYCYVSDGFTYILKYKLETDTIYGKSSGWNSVIVEH